MNPEKLPSSSSFSESSSSSSSSSAPGETHPCYPDDLCHKEAGFIKTRRADAKLTPPSGTERNMVSDSVGLACSGGGIRSATFCLGVGQSLARRGMLKQFDFLSTVSGGGYFGCFLSRLIQWKKSVETAEAEIANKQSRPIHWLRESGYYIDTGGNADVWMIFAQIVRNWVAIHLALFGVFMLPFLIGNALRVSLQDVSYWSTFDSGYMIPKGGSNWGLSGWTIPLIAVVAVGMLLPGILFWVTQFIDKAKQSWWQKVFTRWMGLGMALSAAIALVTLLDMLGLWVYLTLQGSPNLTKGIAATYAGAAAVFASLQRYAGKLTDLAGDKKAPLTMKRMAALAGFVWALLFWLALATLGHWALWKGDRPSADVIKNFSGLTYWSIALGWAVVVCGFSQLWGFVNLSSHHRFYTSRLRRAYLGAANENRKDDLIADNHPDDDIDWVKHKPHEFGGPLHIVNTTVNETTSGKSQIDQRDRKGLSMAVGPAGLSVSLQHHAGWSIGQPSAKQDFVQIQPVGGNGKFRIFPEKDGGREVESLTLSQWMGISGAAFSTGAGANTSTGLSLLLGFANVRLGYWWNSKVTPAERNATRTTLRTPAEFLSKVATTLMPGPHSLVDEMLARFHGPAHQHWYLSDGGHFENTACYELIRRRVRFILCLDCGQDADMMFEDIGNLTRKARIDFCAEITFLNKVDAKLELAEVAKRGWVPDLDLELLSRPEDFTPVKSKDGGPEKDTGKGHALLAKVTYRDSKLASVILFLKPSLTAGLPADIQHYHRSNPDFPQQTTADQFFDEAQWESYRRLGEHIADAVIR